MKKIKQLIIYTFIIFLNGLFITQVNAASATLKISSKSKTMYVGDTQKFTITLSANAYIGAWEFVIDYDTKCLQLVTSDLEGKTNSVGVAPNNKTKSKGYSISFKAKKACSKTAISFSAINAYYYDNSSMKPTTNKATINIVDKSTLSNDSNLKALSVSGYNISPSFDKSKTSYSLTVPNNVRQITVNASKSDSKAKVTGTGKVNLKEGLNKVNVVVTSERGTSKIYTINVTVQEKDPIKVEIDGEEYTVIRKRSDMKAPSTYEDSTVKIKNEEIPSFYNEVTGFNLVGLTDKNGAVNLYIYNDTDNTYTIYNEYAFSGLRIYPFKPDEVLQDAKEIELTIGEDKITGYTLDGIKYPLVYALNVETGKEGWYTYDSEEATLQKYQEGTHYGESKPSSSVTTKVASDKYKNLSYILMGISGILVVFLLIALIRLIPKNKTK